MPHHHATTNSLDLGRGVAFTIQSGALRRQDVLDLRLAEGKKPKRLSSALMSLVSQSV